MSSSIQQFTFFIFTSFLLLIHGFIAVAEAASTIRSGDQLNSTTPPLLSPGGNFTLGFFKIEETNYTYLGIWYTNDDQARKVWVANRDTPIIADDFVLSIDNSAGKLIITSRERTVFSIPDNQGWPGRNISAGIQDSGNFVIVDENENRVLWQSFDYPTNVLLPGMKLGYNLANGRSWNLTSWLSYEVPAIGSFSLSWETNEPNEDSKRLLVRLNGQPYWTSGSLKNQTFEFISNLNAPSSEYGYNLSYVDNKEEKYFIMEGINGNLPMWILRPDGKITDGDNLAVWGTKDFCYGYETDDGCVGNSALSAPCRGRNDRFSIMRTVDFLPNQATSRSLDNSSLSLGDCMETCWKECDCVAFTTSSYGTSCVLWNGRNEYEINERGTSVEKYVLSPRKSRKSNKNWIWIVMAVCISVLVFLGLGVFCYLKRKKRKLRGREDEYFRELMASESLDNTSEGGIDGRKGHDLIIFSYASVVAATNNFSNENKLGEGGFGPVYKGKLADGREIAIKRLSRTSGQGLVEFKNELILIAKLQHTNLVRVLGCCIQGDEKMLIYEYMPNKSLDFFLFDQKKSSILDWQKRVNIIEGIAQGLLYLHKYSRMRVIHRDLKASNVLLDEDMNPKISDFGMARIFKPNETEAMTNRVVGTYGYMSPEYAMEGTFSVKSDVFSFGVLILEIVSGRKNNSFYQLDRPLNLVGYAWELWKDGDAMELKDPTLGQSFVADQLLRTVHVGLLCVQESATDRPTMSEVISMFSNETFSLPYPKQPAFFTGRSAHETTTSEVKAKDYSVNEASITVMEPR